MSDEVDPPEGQEPGDALMEPGDWSTPEWEDPLLLQVAQVEVPLRTPTPGERLGGSTGDRFQILERVGRGGMGQVFRAWDEQLQRVVALKFLSSYSPPQAGEWLLTLVREARAIARLDHDNIVRVFDVSEWKGQSWEPPVHFLVMEHLEGTSLESIIRRRRPALHRTLELMRAITAGLAHAHQHRVVHRDLKPSNVLILRQGQVKLVDFGLAHFTVNAAPHQPWAGTPAYMAPEQWRGEAQDARADVWAAGIMLYELLTGELPYPSNTSKKELGALVSSGAPIAPVRQRHPELPPQVEQVLARALAKAPGERFPTATEFHAALSQLSESLGSWREELPTLGPQRRQVTLVCCRLEGLAGQPPPSDAEDSSEWEAVFQRSCSETLRRYGGTIVSCLGDQVLACFGHPQAREDDSTRAVRAGLHLTATLREQLPRASSETLAVKVGIHTDLVVLDELSHEARGWTPAIQGEAPQLATWLTWHTAPQAVVLSDATWLLVSGAFVAEAPTRLVYEGRSGSRQLLLHRVLKESRNPLRFDRSRSRARARLVGRERELRELATAWETAQSGHGAFVLLQGEAGIGKSRLIRELRQRIATQPHMLLQCQCWAQFQSSAFYPVVEMLQRVFRMAPRDAPPKRLRMLEEQLASLGMTPEHVRLIATFLSLPVAEESPHLRMSPQLLKDKTFEALEALLCQLTAKHPVLVVLEDLQWADPSTVELLGFLVEQCAHRRLCVLLSARQDFQPSWPQPPGLVKLMLDRLEQDQLSDLVRTLARERELPPKLVQELVARANGIPLFVEELTKMALELASTGSSSPSKLPSAIPSTLHELLLSQLDALPHRQKSLAQLCAVVGQRFDHALISALVPRTEAALTPYLEGLLDAGLLEQQDDPSARHYQFRHVLIQEAALHCLPRGTRRQHHRRIVQALLEQFPDVAATQPERLAHHCAEAGDAPAAVHWWLLAGERDSLRSANKEAVSHFTQALSLLDQLPGSAERARMELRLRIELGLPLLQLRGYDSTEVEQTYERARALMGQLGDTLEVPSWGLFHYYHARARFDELEQIGQRFVELGQRQGSPQLLMLGHRTIAGAFYPQGENLRSLKHVELALAYSNVDLEQHRELAVKHWVNLRVDTLCLAALLHAVMGRPDRSRECTRQALELAEQIAHPHTLAFALAYAAGAAQFLRDSRQAMEWATEGFALSGQHGFKLWLGWSALLQFWSTTDLDAIRQGLELVRHGLAQVRGSGVKTLLPLLLGALAEVHWKLGQTEEGLAMLREAWQWSSATRQRFYEAEQHRLEGELLRQRHQYAQAERCFLHAIAVAQQQHALLFGLRATVSLSRQLQEQGQAAQARQRLEAFCARFPPGLDCVDLAEARQLLARL